ncbi:MAG TPA: hypothetical protein VFP72_18780 [Kineosporiaceae bacterium]|nr:hypothetical protein [Kineosporiaceae bacterium]
MTGLHLPSALSAWSQQLSALRPDVAVALGPMLHRLDEMVGRHASVQGPEGAPDGFDGLARRGDPQRLLVSQWALAQEVPEEFLRRAAAAELLYLAQARRHDVVRGQTVLLLDCGPEVQGAARLVQLVMALVLDRRAADTGSQLRVGVLSAPAGSWLEGDLPAVLQGWVAARSRRSTTAEDARAWLAEVDEPAHAWVVTSDGLARRSSTAGARPPRFVTVAESDWTGDGPSAVVVGLAGERLHLSLPPADVSVRVLRGQGWRRRQPAPTSRLLTGAGHGPRLPGNAPTLLVRGRDTGEIITQRVPDPTAQAGRPRSHRFPGPVLAASVLGARLVALVALDGVLETRVLGRRLADVNRISVPLEELGLDSAAIDALVAAPPAEVLFRSGELLVPLAGRWWQLSASGRPTPQPTVAAAVASTTLDNPAVVVRSGGQLWVWTGASTGRFGPVPASGPVPETQLGSGAIAWEGDSGWRLADLPSPLGRAAPLGSGQPPDAGIPLRVDPGVTVAGVTRIGGQTGLVTVGGGGVLVRFVTGEGTRALTRWSGGIGVPALHTRLPLIAVQRDGGAIEVGDLETGQVRLRVEGSS